LTDSIIKPVSVVASCTGGSCKDLTPWVSENQIEALIIVEYVSYWARITIACLHIVCVAGRA
jgi:hypothetical protein